MQSICWLQDRRPPPQDTSSIVQPNTAFPPISWKTSTRESLSDAIRKTLATGNPFFGFDDCYFSPLSSAQLAEEIVRVMRHWIPGVYNLGATTGLSKYEFAVQTAVAFGLDAELIHPRSLASYTGLVSRPFNMMMNVDAYQAAFDTKLPDLEYLIEKTGREPQ